MAKRRKLPASSGDEEKEVDRISMLPDALIHTIMSFMDTQYAIRTSVLSKRWIDIWKSLPFLSFQTHNYTSADFINKVFLLRDHGCSIQRFTMISYSDFVSISSVNRWIKAAVKRNVQEVTIGLGGHSDFVYDALTNGFNYEVPHSLFTCKSLEKLALRMHLKVHVILPKSMSLPQLKFMCLEGCVLANVELSKRLFSRCPLLETLNLIHCDIRTDNPRIFTLESVSLKQFAWTRWSAVSEGEYLFGSPPSIIKLSAPNLNNFTCESSLSKDFHLQNCSDQLSDVKFNILYDYKYENRSTPTEEKQVYARRMVKLLVAVYKVKRLDLSPGFLEVLSSATDLSDCQLPCLCNLQSLRLETWFTCGSLRVIAYLLTISPNIKSLILKPNRSYFADVGDDWEIGFSLPDMLSSLNIVLIENAKGSDAELKILSFLLKNAKGLEEVALYPCSTVDSLCRLEKQFKKKLRELPRTSSHINMRWGATGSTCII